MKKLLHPQSYLIRIFLRRFCRRDMSPVVMNSSSLPQGTPHHELDPIEIDLIREYWKHLEDNDLTRKVVADLFIYIIENYPYLRPIWPFGRRKFSNTEELRGRTGFVNHVKSVTTAFNLCVTYLTNPKWLKHILHDIGNRHFFYDTIEPHFEILGEALMVSLKSNQNGSARFTGQIETACTKMFKVVQGAMQKGIATARQNYLKTALTPHEMVTVAQLWERIRSHGAREAGMSLCSAALHTYSALVIEYGQENYSVSATEESAIFEKFASDTMKALDTTITTYHPDLGFLKLPEVISTYASSYYVTDISPTIVRKSLMEGLISMLTHVLGDVVMTEAVQRTWLKVYRVMEQAIMTNILKL